MRSLRKPTQSVVGSNSEKHSRVATGSGAGAGGGVGHGPVAALVLSARICPMSGNTRVGLLVARFRPGEWYFSVSAERDVRADAELAEQRRRWSWSG